MSMVNTAPGKISVRNLNFYYGKFHALKNINLDITKNQVTAFIGPSGCGKSTLLRTFNKMFELYPEQRAEGEILLDGDNILTNTQDIALLRAKVGMVFQKPTPFPMSIYDNIAFGVRLFEKLSRADMDERVQWALTKAALWNETKDKLHQSGYSLSGGQQQRLCIARGIAIRPEVLLLDEPCSALEKFSQQHQPLLVSLESLGRHTVQMLHDVLDAFARMDLDEAVRIYREDKKVDQEYEGIVRQLMTYMMEDSRTIPSVLTALFCARSIERIGDRCQNICEYIFYFVKGQDFRHVGGDELDKLLAGKDPKE